MKVKLLKKIRKRFSITHYPDGCYFGDDWMKGPITYLWDEQNSWSYRFSRFPKEQAYKELYNIMRGWIERDYRTSRKRKNVRVETLWYK